MELADDKTQNSLFAPSSLHKSGFCSIQLIQDLQCLFCMELPAPDKQNRLLSCKSQLALVSRQLAITKLTKLLSIFVTLSNWIGLVPRVCPGMRLNRDKL